MENKTRKWPLAVIIGVLMAIILFGLVITDLMRLEVIPRDWLLFHDYLSRTGPVKVYTYIVAVLLLLVPTLLPLKLKLITQKSAYLIGFWFLLSSAIDSVGNFMGWYAVNATYSLPWYDNFAHIAGGFIYASLAWIIWENAIEKRGKEVPLRFKIALAVLTSIFCGTVYGIYEYYSDIIRQTYMTGGVEDVITDNVYDIIGALLAGLTLSIHYFRGGIWKIVRRLPYRYLTSIHWE